MTRETVLATLRAHEVDRRGFGVRRLDLFGSFARDEAGPSSDIDLLVEFDHPVGLFALVRLQQWLERLLGRHVDVATSGALRPDMRARVAAELVRAA
ncbi:MAG: nucleotidyltransferase family protein [Deltaproteobacteria bacterium]|nr:nucleotidyltransferase family protein [Deltaproteobacteria bacterium]